MTTVIVMFDPLCVVDVLAAGLWRELAQLPVELAQLVLTGAGGWPSTALLRCFAMAFAIPLERHDRIRAHS